MKHFIYFIISLAIFPLLGLNCTSDDPISTNSNVIALINATLIDGNGLDPLIDAVVLIENDRILSVGTSSDITIPDGAEIIDLNAGYILPGFFNTHVHDGYNTGNLRQWSREGVTTVRDLADLLFNISTTYQTRNNLLINNLNARLVAAGPIVTTVGGYGGYYVTSPSDAVTKVNDLIDAGADLIKIAIEDNLQGRSWPMLSQEEVNAIVETAHNGNIPVSAHISRSHQLAMAIEAGVDDVNHMIVDYLSPALIVQMIEIDMYWVPTLELWYGVSGLYGSGWYTVPRENLRRFVEAGGKVALGTDYAGYTTPFDLGMPMTEIEKMTEAGMTPMQIIVAATKNAAHVCNLENDLGTIETGKIADLFVVTGNPLEDLETLMDISLVIHNGVIIVSN
ncbi:amidohydrolase family protein [Bacteroidota bacterium]